MKNSKLVNQLIEKIEQNSKLITAFTFPYKVFLKQESPKGLLGVATQFKNKTIDAQIDTHAKKILDKKAHDNWDQMHSDLAEFLLKIAEFRQQFETAKEDLLSEASELSHQNYENASLNYLYCLELRSLCHKKMAEALLVDKRTEKPSFADRFNLLLSEQNLLKQDVQEFKLSLEKAALDLAEKQIEQPVENQKISLSAAIANLNNSYQKAYDKNYGVSSFWRWIKDLFKKSDRVKEVQFLSALSSHSECTDGIRCQAISLVHNKILADELFGQGSKLKTILGNLGKAKIDTDEDNSTLANFLENHSDLRELMPKHLASYYDKHSQDYSEKNNAIFLSMA